MPVVVQLSGMPDPFESIPPNWPKPLPPTSVLLGPDGAARQAAYDGLLLPGTRCFWVIPGSVMAGPAPSSEAMLRPLLESGVRSFVDLRMSSEGEEYTELAKELLGEMMLMQTDPAAEGSRAKSTVDVLDHPIPNDMSTGGGGSDEELLPTADMATSSDEHVSELVVKLLTLAASGEVGRRATHPARRVPAPSARPGAY